MPRYTPAEDEMDESYSAPVTPPEKEETATEAKPSVDDENAMSDTALVPNKILSPEGEPLKEGDEIVVRIVRNHGDESEIEYAPKKGAEEESPETSGAAEDFAAMDTEKA